MPLPAITIPLGALAVLLLGLFTSSSLLIFVGISIFLFGFLGVEVLTGGNPIVMFIIILVFILWILGGKK
jgi:hypothetical protein